MKNIQIIISEWLEAHKKILLPLCILIILSSLVYQLACISSWHDDSGPDVIIRTEYLGLELYGKACTNLQTLDPKLDAFCNLNDVNDDLVSKLRVCKAGSCYNDGNGQSTFYFGNTTGNEQFLIEQSEISENQNETVSVYSYNKDSKEFIKLATKSAAVFKYQYQDLADVSDAAKCRDYTKEATYTFTCFPGKTDKEIENLKTEAFAYFELRKQYGAPDCVFDGRARVVCGIK